MNLFQPLAHSLFQGVVGMAAAFIRAFYYHRNEFFVLPRAVFVLSVTTTVVVSGVFDCTIVSFPSAYDSQWSRPTNWQQIDRGARLSIS